MDAQQTTALLDRHQANSIALHGEITTLDDGMARIKRVYTKLHAAIADHNFSPTDGRTGRRLAQLAAVCTQTLRAVNWGDMDEISRIHEPRPPAESNLPASQQ